MTQIYGALLLLGTYFGGAFLILAFSQTLGDLFGKYCAAAELLNPPCQAAAANVAAQGFVAILLLTVVTTGLTRKPPRDGGAAPVVEPLPASPELVSLLLVAVAIVLIVHNIGYRPHWPGGFRAEESGPVSVENLAWPLLLQLIFWTRTFSWKYILIGFLAALLAKTPFRNALFSVFYFGLFIPLIAILHGNRFLSLPARLLRLAAAAIVILGIVVIILYQTGNRYRLSGESAGVQAGRIEQALAFRALAPFFSAVAVEHFARTEPPLPDILASIKQKFHFATNLNEYAARRIFDGDGVSQETTLYYGESVANTKIPPIFWEFAAPLALVLTYFVLRRICDLGVLIAIALWRSSMGGLFDILVAVALQIGFCLVLALLHNRKTAGRPRWGLSETTWRNLLPWMPIGLLLPVMAAQLYSTVQNVAAIGHFDILAVIAFAIEGSSLYFLLGRSTNFVNTSAK